MYRIYLLSSYYVPDTVIGAKDLVINKTNIMEIVFQVSLKESSTCIPLEFSPHLKAVLVLGKEKGYPYFMLFATLESYS